MALLTGLTPDGLEVPVQVKPDGRLVAEGLTGPAGGVGPQGVAGPVGPKGDDQWTGDVNISYVRGKVWIGPGSHEATLEVSGGIGSSPSLTRTEGNFAITQPGLLTSLEFGGYGVQPYGLWLQGKNRSGETFPIVLNPLGGFVGIGTARPSVALHVVGTIRGTNGLELESPDGSLWRIAVSDSGTLTAAPAPLL